MTTTAFLPANVRQILADLETLSHGTTQAWNPAGHNTSEAVMPPGELMPPHVTFRIEYLQATTDLARATIVQLATEELKRFRGHGIDRSHVSLETTAAQEKRILKEGAGEPPDRVALVFHCTPTRVRRLRLANGLSADTGRSTDPRPDSPQAEARRLRDNGLSVRAIAMALATPKSTIHDWLGI